MKKNLLILMMLCVSIFVNSQTVGDTFVDAFITYQVTSISPNTVRVTTYDNNNGGTDADIPATVTNSSTTYSVTSIGNSAFEFNGPTALRLTSIIIPNSITSIGNNAFSSQNLTTVTIPNSVTSIGDSAFSNNDLTTAIIGTSVVSIGQNAFQTNQLTNIVIPNSVTSIGQFAFQSNQLTSATLSNSLTSIEWAAFQINQLQAITIPDSVTSIGNAAFNGNQLTSVTLSNSLLTIGNGAFQNNSITHVTVPSSVTDIDFAAFRENPLATVTSQGTTPAAIFPPGINDSFWNRSVIDLTIPAGTSAAYVAGGWTGFNSVTEAAVPAVGDTFVVDYITYQVTSITPNEVEAIDYSTAGGTVVNIPATVSHSVTNYNVTSIGVDAFGQKQLTSITMPNSITNIKHHAFNGNQLTSVIIPESVTNIDYLAFTLNPLSTVVSLNAIPPTITTVAGGTFGVSNRSNINLVITNNTTDEYVTNSGALWTGFKMVFEATSTTTVQVSNYDPANGTSVVIPATVAAGSMVFDVTKIDDSAFENIGLTSVTIPNSVTNIGNSAFQTNNLTSVSIPDSVTTIGTTAFATNSIANLSLGANVTDIGIGAFIENNLSNVTIPSNVGFIGLLAFSTNPLTSVTSYATAPPTITTGTNDTFAFNRSGIHLHIPPGTIGAYVTDAGALWTGFNPVTQDASLSTSDFELVNNIKVISSSGSIKVMHSNSIKLKSYAVYSITGSKIVSGFKTEIETSTFSKGIYILKLDFDSGIVTKKVIIK